MPYYHIYGDGQKGALRIYPRTLVNVMKDMAKAARTG